MFQKEEKAWNVWLIMQPLLRLSRAKNCMEKPLKIRSGDWPGLPAFLLNLRAAHTLNICSYSPFPFSCNHTPLTSGSSLLIFSHIKYSLFSDSALYNSSLKDKML